MRRWHFAAAVLGFWPAPSVRAQTVTFDFDSGTPALSTGQTTPFDQTSAGLTARFSSPAGPAYSIQSDATTGWRMSRFSGRYVYANNQNRNVLDIAFSQPVTAITLAFATADFQQVEVPTTMQLAAYAVSNSGPVLGSATAHGAYGSDTMPMGTLAFDAGGQPFSFVEISVPFQPRGASAFFVDNVTVAVRPARSCVSVSAASYAAGAPVAAGSIAAAFGQGLASATEQAVTLPLPLSLANTTVTVRDSAGADRQAELFYVSPTQINYLVPEGSAAGPAAVTVTSGGQLSGAGTVDIQRVAPGLFTAGADGNGPPAGTAITVALDLTQSTQAVAQCGTAPGTCVASPIDLGPSGARVILVLYGTGIRGRSSLAGVAAGIDSIAAEVQYAGPQAQYAGLDQVNVMIPEALAGRGEVDLALSVDGKPANIVRVNIK